MNHLSAVLLAAVVVTAAAQFPSGRILEPPVPSLCVQRTIHERYADSEYLSLPLKAN